MASTGLYISTVTTAYSAKRFCKESRYIHSVCLCTYCYFPKFFLVQVFILTGI